MDHFCVIANRDKDINYKITKQIIEYLQKHNKTVVNVNNEDETDLQYTDVYKIPRNTECAIVLGGDGTIIQAAHDLAQLKIPILGVNMGTLGFLAEIETNNLLPALDAVMNDQCSFENRMLICGELECDGKSIYAGNALNDIVINRSGFTRLINVEMYVNQHLIDTYLGDGMIISTPTGSTSYSLSAGGPVVTPGSNNIIITPICPHSLNTRSIIVSGDDEVVAKIGISKKTQLEEAIVTFDGCVAFELRPGNEIKIRKSKNEIHLVKINQASFFDILRTKLGH